MPRYKSDAELDYYKKMKSYSCTEEDDIDIVQHIDMKEIREIIPPVYLNVPSEKKRIETERQRNRPMPQKEFDVLPMNEPAHHIYRPVLSLHENPYLTCRFQNFLSSGVKGYPNLESQEETTQQVRVPFRLNGNHYDRLNKPAPVPHIPHPSTHYKKVKGDKAASSSSIVKKK